MIYSVVRSEMQRQMSGYSAVIEGAQSQEGDWDLVLGLVLGSEPCERRGMLCSQGGDPRQEVDLGEVPFVPNPEGLVLPPGEARPEETRQLGFELGDEFQVPTPQELVRQRVEKGRCRDSLLYFVQKYCHIEDQASQGWIRFMLWVEQAKALEALAIHPQVILLKARQLGLTWLLVCYALWVLLHRGGSGVLRKRWLLMEGKLAFKVKDYIDRKFMKEFQAIE